MPGGSDVRSEDCGCTNASAESVDKIVRFLLANQPKDVDGKSRALSLLTKVLYSSGDVRQSVAPPSNNNNNNNNNNNDMIVPTADDLHGTLSNRSHTESTIGAKRKPAVLQVGSVRYKTELCRQFVEHGICNYGNKCQYAHGECELRSLNRHPKYKTEMCRSYHTTGFCAYGHRCHFIHNEEERQLGENHVTSPSPGCVGDLFRAHRSVSVMMDDVTRVRGRPILSRSLSSSASVMM